MYPKIFENKLNGEEAKKLFDDAQEMINHVIKNNLIEAKAVFGLYRANSNGDDIEVYDNNKNTIANFITLRQQKEKGENFFNKALSDYVAPKESDIEDYIDVFVLVQVLDVKIFQKNTKKITMITQVLW